MNSDHTTTSRLTIRLTLAGCAALLPLSMALAAAPLQEQPTPKQETSKPAAGEQEGSKPAEGARPQDDAKKDAEAKKKEEAKKQEDDSELDELNPFRRGGAGGADPQAEMRELFLKVDKRLNRVTELLFEASAGDMSSAGEIGSAGIDELIREAESQAGGARSDIAKLLEASRAQSEAASGEIGRILEIAQQQSSGGGSGGGGQQQSQPQPGEGQPQQGQTPSGSRREDKGERGPDGEQPRNQPGGQDPQQQEQQQDQPGDGKPDGNQDSDQQDQRPGEDPPESETGDPANAAGNENWGELPVHLRRVFENSVSDDVPARYRDWVDSYYKRLARRSGR